jgi:hypothetical protein
VLERVIDYCFRNGFPKNIRSDNGPQFSNSQWNDVCRALRINPKKVVPYRLQGNSAERVNLTLKHCIKVYAKNHRDWDEHLSAIAFGIRTAVSETTGFKPSVLTFVEELISPLDPPVLHDAEPPDPSNYHFHTQQCQFQSYHPISQSTQTLSGQAPTTTSIMSGSSDETS